MSKIYHAFDTENLSVFAAEIETELHSIPRLQLLAYHRKEDRPMLVANMLLMGHWDHDDDDIWDDEEDGE